MNSNLHWSYFLSIESDLDSLSRYIEFSENNYSVYSVELLRILLMTSAEIDDLMKVFCGLLEPDSKSDSIGKYRGTILRSYSGLLTRKVVCLRYGLEFEPYKSWDVEDSPLWWQSHNKVKHHRSSNYQLANLGNVLNAVAGLYLLNIHCNHVLGELETKYPREIKSTISQLRSQCDMFRIDDPWAYWHD